MLFEQAKTYFEKYPNNVTRSAYIKNYRKFIDFCRKEFDCKTADECKEHIAAYVDFLVQKGLTPNTIHTYIAPVAIYHGVPMEEIEKPKRCAAHNVRSRSNNGRQYRSDNDESNPKYARTVEFQKRVGIRRNELANLHGNDYLQDADGNFFVIVRKGKGGKRQLQRILPEDIEFVKAYFNGTEDKVFKPKELNNQLDYHSMRAAQAKRAYKYYLDRMNSEPDYRTELENEICRHWNERCLNKKTKKPKPINKSDFSGTYKLRGENKKLAIKNGLPTEYDRLAVLATSIFHLSHWRLNVAVSNYLLAVRVLSLDKNNFLYRKIFEKSFLTFFLKRNFKEAFRCQLKKILAALGTQNFITPTGTEKDGKRKKRASKLKKKRRILKKIFLTNRKVLPIFFSKT